MDFLYNIEQEVHTTPQDEIPKGDTKLFENKSLPAARKQELSHSVLAHPETTDFS